MEELSHQDAYNIIDILNKNGNRRVILTNKDNINDNFKIDGWSKVHKKPFGLWYALGDSWIVYLQQEFQKKLSDYDSAFLIDIDYSNILRLNTLEKIYQFETEYGFSDSEGLLINWDKVKTKYTGIEIIPLQWDIRRSSQHRWYNQWDIASGCIWNGTAIKQSKLIYSSNNPESFIKPFNSKIRNFK